MQNVHLDAIFPAIVTDLLKVFLRLRPSRDTFPEVRHDSCATSREVVDGPRAIMDEILGDALWSSHRWRISFVAVVLANKIKGEDLVEKAISVARKIDLDSPIFVSKMSDIFQRVGCKCDLVHTGGARGPKSTCGVGNAFRRHHQTSHDSLELSERPPARQLSCEGAANWYRRIVRVQVPQQAIVIRMRWYSLTLIWTHRKIHDEAMVVMSPYRGVLNNFCMKLSTLLSQWTERRLTPSPSTLAIDSPVARSKVA